MAVAAFAALTLPAQAANDRSEIGIAHEIAGYFGFGPDQANNPTDPQPVNEHARPALSPRDIAPSMREVEAPPPRLPVVTAVAPPSVETPLHRLFCVEYARMRSGLA